jgi:predicted N-acetyltransferase YhbS
MKIVKYKSKFKDQVSFVILNSYIDFCAKDATEEAVEDYKFRCDSKKNKNFEDRLKKFEILYLAEEKGKIVGVIGGRNQRITNLFVLGSEHKKGIGKKLLYCFEKKAKELEWESVKLRSSLFGLPFYQKMGYKKTTGQRIFHGNKIQPVKKYL